MAVQQHVHKAMIIEEKKNKAKSWREWCVAAFTTATHGWKYLKQQFAQELTPQCRGQPLVGTQALKTVTAPWLELWNEHAEHDICEAPMQQLELPTYEDMMHVLRRYPKKKAIGVDGWSFANWAALPDVLTKALHQLVCRAKELAYTPTAWATKVVLIPKQGVAEKRPIAITPLETHWTHEAKTHSTKGTKSKGCVLARGLRQHRTETSALSSAPFLTSPKHLSALTTRPRYLHWDRLDTPVFAVHGGVLAVCRSVVVDDIQVAWEGPARDVIEVITWQLPNLLYTVAGVKLPVSRHKTFTMASMASGMRALQQLAVHHGIDTQWQAKFVGGQVVSGRNRRVVVQNKRIGASNLKLKRLKGMRLVIQYAKHPMRASVASTGTWGQAQCGVAESKARHIRTEFTRLLVRFSKRGSPQVMASTHPQLHGADPMRLAHADQFANWYRLLRTPELSEIDRLAAMGGAAARILRSRKGWSTVHGPVAATLMTAIRLDCSIHHDGSITDHRGIRHDIHVDGVKRVEEAMQDAHDDWAESLPRFAHNKLHGLTAEARMLANKCKEPMHKFAIGSSTTLRSRQNAGSASSGRSDH
eukprot:1013103-Amphidinium_carterae.1